MEDNLLTFENLKYLVVTGNVMRIANKPLVLLTEHA